MIQLLYTYDNEVVLKEVLDTFGFPFIKVPEMKEGAYLTLLKRNQVLDFEAALLTDDLEMVVIGSYRGNGSKHRWVAENRKKFNHTVNKYRRKLNDIVTYDEDGSVKYGERRVIKKATFDHVNEKKVEIEESLRFSDFANVRMSSSQKGGRKTYTPRITVASPTSFTIAIDNNDEEVSFILDFKGV